MRFSVDSKEVGDNEVRRRKKEEVGVKEYLCWQATRLLLATETRNKGSEWCC